MTKRRSAARFEGLRDVGESLIYLMTDRHVALSILCSTAVVGACRVRCLMFRPIASGCQSDDRRWIPWLARAGRLWLRVIDGRYELPAAGCKRVGAVVYCTVYQALEVDGREKLVASFISSDSLCVFTPVAAID